VEGEEWGQGTSREKFQRRPTAGRHVGNLIGKSHLVNRGGAVPSTDDGDRLAVCGHGAGNFSGALGKSLVLEQPHRAIPEDRLSSGDLLSKQIPSLGADV